MTAQLTPPTELLTADPLDTAPAQARQRFVFLRNRKALAGLVILGAFTFLAIIGPWIAPYDPAATDAAASLQPPSADHWFGTTRVGQDVLSQVLVGARSVMVVGLVSGAVATFLSVLVGLTAGYVGGVVDESLSALGNVFLVLPALPLIIIIASMIERAGSVVVALVISFTAWAWNSRIIRAQTLSLRRRDFVEAARANGEGRLRIITAEILPNLTAIIASSFVGTVTFAVIAQITLSFIGLIPTSDWSWGTILYLAQSDGAFANGSWWWWVPPVVAIALLGMALTLVNFGIDEFVNPRLRSTAQNAKLLRKRGIRPRIGFTPIARDTYAVASDRDTTAVRPPGAGREDTR